MRCTFLLAVLCSSPVAFAGVAPSEGGPSPLADALSAEKSELTTDNAVSARLLAGGVALPNAGAAPLVGIGAAYERDIAHGAVAVEFAVEGAMSTEAASLLFEMVIEKPVELSDGVGVYFGGGPTATLHFFENGGVAPGWGGLGLVGVEMVVVDDLEFFVEMDTALLYTGIVAMEADVGTGLMVRF